MIEIDAIDGPLPLGMAPERFLREYWQKKPLLIRNAFPHFESPIQPEDLAGLACEDGALARIVNHDQKNDRWTPRLDGAGAGRRQMGRRCPRPAR